MNVRDLDEKGPLTF